MDISNFPDPFEQKRLNKGIGQLEDQDDPVQLVLRHKDVRKTAHNYKVFTSYAKPGRIVIPSEISIRDTRQIPLELDPTIHSTYRSLMEPWFKRPLEASYAKKLKVQISRLIENSLNRERVEIIADFALVLQSRALTLLLNIPIKESEIWISWGTHVFRSDGNALDADKANILYTYIDKQIEYARSNPGPDLYTKLLQTEVDGRKLSPEEIKGVMVLTFAGGRDTIINAVTNSLAYFAEHPEALERLRTEPDIINKAVEEMIRYFSPLTQMGRVVTEDTQICEHAIKKDSRVSLCWASANRDATVFEKADDIILDRKINPHVGFGFSHHNCLGASHARQIMRILFATLSEKVGSISLVGHNVNIEDLDEFKRKVGYDSLTVTFNRIQK